MVYHNETYQKFSELGLCFYVPGDLYPPYEVFFFKKIGIHEKNAVSVGRMKYPRP
jgi:hypothetical protein